MILRNAVLALVALAACGGPGGATLGAPPIPVSAAPVVPSVVTYRPYAATYRAATRRHVEQEFNGQKTATTLAIDYYLSTDIIEVPEGLQATLRIDSVPYLVGLPLKEAERVQGASFTTLLTNVGTVRAFEGSDLETELLDQLELQMQGFFPRLPPGGALPGVEWADTAETNAGMRDRALLIHSINRHEIVGWNEWGGERALHIVTVSDYTLEGSGIETGQSYTLEGSGTERANRYVASDGRFLGLTSTDTLHSTVHLPLMGTSIPITQTRTDSLTIVQ